MDFEIVGLIKDIQPIAVGRGVDDRTRLNKLYGKGRWRKLKGFASVRLPEIRSTQQSFIGTRPMGSAAES